MEFDLQKIYIEPTSFCNLKCKMCSRSAWFDEKIGEMEESLFNKIIEEVKDIESVHTIFFGGIAEPFAHSNLLSMVKKAKETNKKVELITNGLLLNENSIRELINLNIDTIWVSVDGCDMESYSHIRVGGNFDKINKNLKLIKELKLDLKINTKLGLAFVAMKSNLDQLPKIITLARLVGAAELKVSNVIPYSEEMEKEILYDYSLGLQWFSDFTMPSDGRYMNFLEINMPIMDYWKESISPVINQVLHNGKIVKLGDNYIIRKSQYCKFINDNAIYIRWDGEVSPCTSLLHNNITYIHNTKRKISHCSYGNVKEDSIIKIWNKEDYSTFRDNVRNFTFSNCVTCGICELAQENLVDCYGNKFPTCGACLWSEGFIQCP